MFREHTDAPLRTLLMVVATLGLITSIVSPIAIRAHRATVQPASAGSIETLRPAQQDYNGSRPGHAPAATLIGLTLVTDDVVPADRSR